MVVTKSSFVLLCTHLGKFVIAATSVLDGINLFIQLLQYISDIINPRQLRCRKTTAQMNCLQHYVIH